jgi:uncharacterized integral membrane protein (TIGR00698 family)
LFDRHNIRSYPCFLTLMQQLATTTQIESGRNSASAQASIWPGLALASVIALLALGLGHTWPLVGGPVFGIVLGILVRNTRAPRVQFQPGIKFAGKQVLQWSIVALGLNLSLDQVVRTGASSLEVTAVTVAAAFVSAALLGKWLGIPSRLKLLIGIGTAICGGSAIAAATPIVRADEHETAFAISTIFLFNLVAVLLFPTLGHLMHLSAHGFGLWAGTAINDTSSVVAAGYTYSKAAGDYATIVKLTRATLIIPVCLVLAAIEIRRHRKHGRSDFSLRRIFPWFIAWFVVAAALDSAGLIPHAWAPYIHDAAQFMIIIALTAIGLSSDLRRMASTGAKPILLGLGVWAAVAFSSLGVQLLMGQL